MTGLPALRSRLVVKGVKKFGFEKVGQKGSHAIFHHSDCRFHHPFCKFIIAHMIGYVT